MTKLCNLIAPAVLAMASLSFAAAPALAQEAPTAGKSVYSADGKRVGAVYKVGADGSLQLILNGKLVSVPASTVSVADGKITTSLTKKELTKR
ncbi:MAG: hypothetical protein ABW194_04555 [Novosphingobium sp.]